MFRNITRGLIFTRENHEVPGGFIVAADDVRRVANYNGPLIKTDRFPISSV